MDQTMSVTVISPQKTLFAGEALSLSSQNSAGQFDVLPNHANFITFISNDIPILITKVTREQLTFKFPMAIICNLDNQVTIYAQLDISKV